MIAYLKRRPISIYVGCCLLVIIVLKLYTPNKQMENNAQTVEQIHIIDKFEKVKLNEINIKDDQMLTSKSSCNAVINLNPFEEEITKVMSDFKQHICQPLNELKLQFKENNKLLVSAYKLNFISGSNILKKNGSYEITEKKLLSKPLFDPTLKKGL